MNEEKESAGGVHHVDWAEALALFKALNTHKFAGYKEALRDATQVIVKHLKSIPVETRIQMIDDLDGLRRSVEARFSGKTLEQK